MQIAAQLDSPYAIQRSVGKGLGVSIVSRLSAIDYAQLGNIRIIDPAGEPIRRQLFFIHHKSRPLSLSAAAFTRFAMEKYEKTK